MVLLQVTGRGWAEEIALLLISLKPEFPGINWWSLGTKAGNTEELKGSNEMLFIQLVEEKCWDSPEKVPGTRSAAARGRQPKPQTPSIQVCEI